MAGIQEARAKGEQWAQQGKGTGGDFRAYFPFKDDVVFFHFIWTGLAGDPYWEEYLAHEYAAPPGSNKFTTYKVCPVESGFDVNYDCSGCKEGVKLKKRMAMWMYIANLLTKRAPAQGENLPVVNYMGQTYYNREVNGVRIWDTSGWKDSPLDTILYIGETLLNAGQNMHYAQFTLNVHGDGRDRRFKVIQVPGSAPLPAEIYEREKPNCEPVRNWLMAQLTPSELVAAPGAAQFTPAAPLVAPAAPAPAPAFVPAAPPAPAAATFVPAQTFTPPAPAAPAPLPFDPAQGQTQTQAPAQAVATHQAEAAPATFTPVSEAEAKAFQQEAAPPPTPPAPPAGVGAAPVLPASAKSLF